MPPSHTPAAVGISPTAHRNVAHMQAGRSLVAPRPPPLLVLAAYHAASPERAAFQAAVQREGAAFAELIRARQHVVLPRDMGQDCLQQVWLARGHMEQDPAAAATTAVMLIKGVAPRP
jgi:hypothetical protein